MPDEITHIAPHLNSTNVGIGVLLALYITKWAAPHVRKNGNGSKKPVTEDICQLRGEIIKNEVSHLRTDMNNGFTNVEKLIRNGQKKD